MVAQAPTIQVDKTADPRERNEPGGAFTFDVVVTNPGINELTITSLTDDVYGDLNDPANPNVVNNTCEGAVGTTIAANGGTFSCSFDGEFTGNAGDSETDTVTVTGEDNLGQQATDSDDATVTLVGVPPAVDAVDGRSDLATQRFAGGGRSRDGRSDLATQRFAGGGRSQDGRPHLATRARRILPGRAQRLRAGEDEPPRRREPQRIRLRQADQRQGQPEQQHEQQGQR